MTEDAEMKQEQDAWRVWGRNERTKYYGEMLFRRATGELPEMESSKAAAARVAKLAFDGCSILDVGCGAGHYLVSLRRALDFPFTYCGVDATESYINLAREAFADDEGASFRTADVFELPFTDRTFDIVMCNNLLLHLPSIRKPLSELYRVARRHVMIRTLIGETTYRIQESRSDELASFDETDAPSDFHYLNIYSMPLIKSMVRELDGAEAIIEEDADFSADAINAESPAYFERGVRTNVIAGRQVGGHVIHPWAFLQIQRK
jgi:ubiquinone/menaquinone biosynthesis C-methylase UbiE